MIGHLIGGPDDYGDIEIGEPPLPMVVRTDEGVYFRESGGTNYRYHHSTSEIPED